MARKPVHINKICGERLSELLTENNMNASDLADEVGYTPQHISYIINSKRNLTKEAAEDISNFFGVQPEWLLGLSDYKTAKDMADTFIKKTLTLTDSAIEIIKAAASNIGYSMGHPNKKAHDKDGISFYLFKDGSCIPVGKADAVKLIEEVMRITEYALSRMINENRTNDNPNGGYIKWLTSKSDATKTEN